MGRALWGDLWRAGSALEEPAGPWGGLAGDEHPKGKSVNTTLCLFSATGPESSLSKT